MSSSDGGDMEAGIRNGVEARTGGGARVDVDSDPPDPIGGADTEAAPRDEGATDAAPRDEGATDAAPRDEGATDAAPRDEGATDAAPRDKGATDAAPRDKGATDAAPRDKGATDVAPRDEGATDAAPRDEGATEGPLFGGDTTGTLRDGDGAIAGELRNHAGATGGGAALGDGSDDGGELTTSARDALDGARSRAPSAGVVLMSGGGETEVGVCSGWRENSLSASEGGGFAAGATPAIVGTIARGAVFGRGIRDALSLSAPRPSDPNAAPVPTLNHARTAPRSRAIHPLTSRRSVDARQAIFSAVVGVAGFARRSPHAPGGLPPLCGVWGSTDPASTRT